MIVIRRPGRAPCPQFVPALPQWNCIDGPTYDIRAFAVGHRVTGLAGHSVTSVAQRGTCYKHANALDAADDAGWVSAPGSGMPWGGTGRRTRRERHREYRLAALWPGASWPALGPEVYFLRPSGWAFSVMGRTSQPSSYKLPGQAGAQRHRSGSYEAREPKRTDSGEVLVGAVPPSTLCPALGNRPEPGPEGSILAGSSGSGRDAYAAPPSPAALCEEERSPWRAPLRRHGSSKRESRCQSSK